MDFKLTTQDVWSSTLVLGLSGLLLLLPLAFIFRNDNFQRAGLPITLTSAIAWGIVAMVAFRFAWEFYYQYLYPQWARRLGFASALFYGPVALGMWWLSSRLPGSAVVWFAVIGGLEGVGEHLFGIYSLHILEKVPWLRGITPLPVVIFSFFEYILYWTAVAWIAYGCSRLGQHL